MELVRTGASTSELAKPSSLIRRDLFQLNVSFTMLQQQAELLNHRHLISSREYLDFMADLSDFQKALKLAKSKAAPTLQDAGTEEFVHIQVYSSNCITISGSFITLN